MNPTVNTSMKGFVFASLALILLSCNNSTGKPDVSGVKVNAKIERFDQAFFSLDTNNLSGSLNELNKKYPAFLSLYSEFLSPINFIVHQQGKSFEEALRIYLRNIKPLYDEVQKQYSSLDDVQKNLQKDLKYVKHYFPSYKIPVVIASVENLNPEEPQEIYGTALYHDTLIISLQMFLGKDFAAYDPSQYPDYLRRRFVSSFIVPNSIRVIANDIHPDTSESNSLIETMIERGKQWFLMKRFMPDAPDSLITGYTKNQMEFVDKNEGNIWSEFLKDTPDPYTLDQERFKNYIGEAPFTQDMPHDLEGGGTPGNIGQWIGWRIVEKFASENSKMGVQEIINTASRQIFQQAKYKPK